MNANKKAWMIALGAVSGVTALAVGAVAVWNSKQMRLMRAAKRTGRLLFRVGSAMQAVSGLVDKM